MLEQFEGEGISNDVKRELISHQLREDDDDSGVVHIYIYIDKDAEMEDLWHE